MVTRTKKAVAQTEKADDGFEMKVLYKIRRDILTNKSSEKLGEDRLQVVQYKRGKPRVEKRNYWIDKEGELKMGKLKGLLIEDFEVIDEKWAGIEKALNQGK